jgi:hypothetical protein
MPKRYNEKVLVNMTLGSGRIYLLMSRPWRSGIEQNSECLLEIALRKDCDLIST